LASPANDSTSSEGNRRSGVEPRAEYRAAGTKGDRRSGIERRISYRARTLVAGKVLVGEPITDCVVRNLSVRGAHVRLLGAVKLPPTIQLLLTSEGLLFDATIIWRRADKIGLAFTAHRDLRHDDDANCAAVRASGGGAAPL